MFKACVGDVAELALATRTYNREYVLDHWRPELYCQVYPHSVKYITSTPFVHPHIPPLTIADLIISSI